ncbi:MAG: phosphoprotein phosphatase [Deltaproteobacteria bacterium]|nr:MAG: phosphoprotein phosphatase [Deltaproteobacteria bacterium]
MDALLAHAATDVGRVRDHNEDAYWVDPKLGAFAVCDGMGGHAAGEVASALAIQVVRDAWTSRAFRAAVDAYAREADADRRRALLAAVRSAVARAHDAIRDAARADPERAGMGTTFTGFVCAGGDAVFAHAGDSRAYLVRDGIAMQLTEDHTVVARLAAAGLGSGAPGYDPARWQGVLTNALGIGDRVRVATFVVPMAPVDRFVLCSDGVTEYVAEAEIGEIVARGPSPARSAQALVDAAVTRGGADNATAVVVKVLEVDPTPVPRDERERDEAILAASPLLGGLSPQQRLRALRIALPQRFDAGRAIPPVALGDRVAYLVLDGAARLPGGDLVRAGDLLYARALAGGPAPAEAARAQTAVKLLAIRRDDFAELAADDEELGVKLYDALADITGSGE